MLTFSANLDVLMISETKFEIRIPGSQVYYEEFSEPYRHHRTVNGKGILLHVREDIPTNYTKWIRVRNSFEGLFVELNLRNKKWLLRCSYKTQRDNIISHLNIISNALDKVCTDYEYLILLDGFHLKQRKNICLDL